MGEKTTSLTSSSPLGFRESKPCLLHQAQHQPRDHQSLLLLLSHLNLHTFIIIISFQSCFDSSICSKSPFWNTFTSLCLYKPRKFIGSCLQTLKVCVQRRWMSGGFPGFGRRSALPQPLVPRDSPNIPPFVQLWLLQREEQSPPLINLSSGSLFSCSSINTRLHCAPTQQIHPFWIFFLLLFCFFLDQNSKWFSSE